MSLLKTLGIDKYTTRLKTWVNNKIDTKVAELVDSAPETLDTLKEVADAIQENETVVDALESAIGNKANKSDVTTLQKKVDSNTEQIESQDVLIEDLQESKADVSGYYPQLSVGQADNLPDRGDVVEGLLGFRESAGAGNSIEDGTANVQELLGESLVWNQRIDASHLVKNMLEGNTVTQLGNGYVRAEVAQGVVSGGVTISKTWTGIVVGHKYAAQVDLITSAGLTLYVLGLRKNNIAESTKFLVEATDTTIFLTAPNAVVEEQSISFDARFLLTDLTQMFGAGNEPTTVEEFEAIKNQLVGVDFTAYNAGEVLGVNIKGIKSVNDNAWDEEWESGGLDTTTGENIDYNGRIRSKNFIKVLGGQEYYFSSPSQLAVRCYDINKNFLGQSLFPFNGTAVIPSNCAYIRFNVDYTTTYNHDICIRLAHSGYKTDYVAHEESESSFDLTPYFPNGMHGINGVRDSVTKSKATRRFGMVKMKDLSWSYYADYGFYATMPSDMVVGNLNYLIERPYTKFANPDRVTWEGLDKSVTNGLATIGTSWVRNLVIKDSAYTDAASFIASLTDDDILIYELATPIETEIDPQLNMNYKVWDFGTEELLTDSKSAPVLARTIYGFNATDTIRGNKAKIEDHEERISDLENEVVRVGDYQPDLSVGVADNLAGTDYTESEIGFRRSGGGAILDGNARVSSVKGNSVVWNQIVKAHTSSKEANGVHIISQGDDSIKVYTDDTGATEETATSSDAIYLLPSHKYAVFGTPQQSGSVQYYIWWTGLAALENGGGLIKTYSGNGDASYWSIVINAGTVIPQSSPIVFRPRVIDLTLMFGAGNEPTTIEEFYARKPKVADENAYNEGEVIHMEADAIKSVGVNQWDEEWELGVFLDTGEVYAKEGYENAIHTKNYIPVIVGQQYYFNHPNSGVSYVCEYDANKNFIRRVSLNYEKKHTVPVGVSYVRFSTYSNYGPTYKNDICINLSDTEVNGKYFPYVKREQTLEMLKKYFPNGMKSAGTAHDEIRWNAQKQKWEAIKRIGEVDMGTLNWSRLLATDRYLFNVQIQGILPATIDTYTSNILQSKYAFDRTSGTSIQEDKTIRRWATSIYIRDDAYTDAATFKAAMQGVMLYYELAEPIVTEIDENFNLDYEVWNAGTEQMIADTPSTPVKASIAYGFNAVGKIKQLEEIIAQLQTAIANLSNS